VTVWRNLRSRASRTFFTVAGIAIGILALTVVGSLAERLQTIVARSTALNAGAIFAVVRPSLLVGNGARGTLEADYAKLEVMDDVRAVVPEVILPYLGAGGDFGRVGPAALIFGIPEAARRLGSSRSLTVARGRDLLPEERRTAVIGADFAASEQVHVGDQLALYGNSFSVVGILDKSFTLFDQAVIVPFADAQALEGQVVPPGTTALPKDPISAFLVVLRDQAKTAIVVQRINLLDGIQARDPNEIANAVRSTLAIFDGIIFGAASIALVVGAFSIVNTMTIAVAERTREIGIRKAIGATDADILREFVAEAAAIGLLGGVTGVALGFAIVTVIDARAASGGTIELFAISPEVGFGAIAFAVAIAVIAGFWPAYRAARLAPTEALRR
jgi:putative ABC transport system permease protein